MRGVMCLLCLVLVMSAAAASASPAVPPQAAADVKSAVTAPINLNTASAEQLQKLPGIGPKTATRIIEDRQKNGAFKKIEELMNIRGVGEKSFIKIKAQITVAPAKANIP